MAKVIDEATDVPSGAFHTLSASDKGTIGDAMTADQRFDLYHFTGSPGVGQRIAERAANGIRHTVLELGGKSGNILLPDADLDMACGLGVAMCMSNSGQGCALATRMIVHASIYDDVLARLEMMVGHLPWGDPNDPGNLVGPIIRLEQLERMEGLVKRAEADGARILVGGKRGPQDKGFWFEPTVLVDVDENAEIAQTEVFGPVPSVIKYDGDDDEAVRIANNTRYGRPATSSPRTRSAPGPWPASSGPALSTSTTPSTSHPTHRSAASGSAATEVEHGVAGFRGIPADQVDRQPEPLTTTTTSSRGLSPCV